MQTVRLTTCNTSYEAHLIKGRLEAEGIPSVLTNENMASLYSGLISAFTGIDILVNEDDLEQAKEIIGALNNNVEITT